MIGSTRRISSGPNSPSDFRRLGLWPIILAPAAAEQYQFGSTDSAPRSTVAEVLLADWWHQLVEEFESDAPNFFRNDTEFSGLVARQTICGLSPADLARQGPAIPQRLALVPVRRPSDVLVTIGWNGTEDSIESTEELGVVLESWHDLVGAHLVALAPNGFDIYIERPPVREADRRRWAAELLTVNSVLVDAANFDEFVENVSFSDDQRYGFTWF